MTGAIIGASQFAARSLPRIGPRRLMTTGALLGNPYAYRDGRTATGATAVAADDGTTDRTIA